MELVNLFRTTNFDSTHNLRAFLAKLESGSEPVRVPSLPLIPSVAKPQSTKTSAVAKGSAAKAKRRPKSAASSAAAAGEERTASKAPESASKNTSAASAQTLTKSAKKAASADFRPVWRSGTAESAVKPCKCKRSKCLKLYCDCFAAGIYCVKNECTCVSCHNTGLPKHAQAKEQAIEAILDRNPIAFTRKTIPDELMARGCSCRKSNCLKNYCECHLAGKLCNELCRCVGCNNHDGIRVPMPVFPAKPTTKVTIKFTPSSSSAFKMQELTETSSSGDEEEEEEEDVHQSPKRKRIRS